MADIPEPTLAIRFLERKNLVPTDKWDDLKWGEHAHAFTVAHSVEADILNTLHSLLNDAVKNGEAYETWRKKVLDMMHEKNWYGGNGHTAGDKKYISWRLRLIYDTNMRTAYSAAQYRKQLQDAEGRPIWVYKSKLSGKNRRQEHIALHNKAFRYDDPFWNTYYPPNGWGCQCSVTTKSIAGAERDGITVGDSAKETLPDIDETWKYNVGREALAPHFKKYEHLKKVTMPDGRSAFNHVIEQYQKDMNHTRMTLGEFKVFLKRIDKRELFGQDSNVQVGNLDMPNYQAMQQEGVEDSKIMCTLRQLGHGIGNKVADQKIKEERYDELYQVLQSPEHVYENMSPDNPLHGREFHFVGKKGKDGKILNVVLRFLKRTALQIITMGAIEDHHEAGNQYKKIR